MFELDIDEIWGRMLEMIWWVDIAFKMLGDSWVENVRVLYYRRDVGSDEY